MWRRVNDRSRYHIDRFSTIHLRPSSSNMAPTHNRPHTSRRRGGADTSRRSLAINAACNWLTFVSSVLVAFVMSPVLVRGLGAERYGVWSLVEALVAWFALLDMGVGASVVRYVAKFEAADDHDQLNRVFNTTLCLFLAAAIIALTASGLLAAAWQRPFGLPADLAATTRWLIVLLGANVAVELVAGVFSAVLYGLGRFPAKTAIAVSLKLVGAVVLYVLLQGGGGLITLALVGLAASLVRCFLNAAAVRYYLPRLRYSPRLATWDVFHTIKGYSIRAFLIMIAGRISHRIDALVIGAFLAPQYITYFVIGSRLVEYAKDAVSSLSVVLTPAVSALESRQHTETIGRAFSTATRYALWLAIPLQLGFIIFGRAFLELWIGHEVAKLAFPVLLILSSTLIFSLPMIPASRVLYGLGDLRALTWIALLEAPINLALSLLLVRTYEVSGVAFGTVLPQFARACAILLLTHRRLQLSYSRFLAQSLLLTFLSAGLLAPLWLNVTVHLSLDRWVGLLTAAMVGLVPYAAMVTLIELRLTDAHRPVASRIARTTLEETGQC